LIYSDVGLSVGVVAEVGFYRLFLTEMKAPSLKKLPQSMRIWKHKRTAPGAAPGVITLSEDALQPRLFLTSFNTEKLLETPMENIGQVKQRIDENPELLHWVELKGLVIVACWKIFVIRFAFIVSKWRM
jgi:hypothetical protein